MYKENFNLGVQEHISLHCFALELVFPQSSVSDGGSHPWGKKRLSPEGE